ncbi:hypothetical protein ACFCYB_26085 [Streptomyces sp. NPDC056309]|uniref:hypothetical protein n=1 Tax=unclassified Streptomyces TaxID=2593676 RepID=UPI0035E385D4
MITELRERWIDFTSLHDILDTTTPGGGVAGRPTVANRASLRQAVNSHGITLFVPCWRPVKVAR